MPGGKRSLRTPASPNNGGYLKAYSRVTRTNVFQAIFCYLDGEFRLFSLVESGSVKVMHWAGGNGSERFAGEYLYFSLWTKGESFTDHFQEALQRDDQWRLLLRAPQNDGMKDLQMSVMGSRHIEHEEPGRAKCMFTRVYCYACRASIHE